MSSELRVAIDGAGSSSLPVDILSGPPLATPLSIRVTDGVDIAAVSTSGTSGNQLLVSSGSQSSIVTLNAVAGNTTGTTADFGSAKSDMTAVAVYTGTITGTLTLEISVDNATFVSSTITFTLPGAAGSTGMYSIGRPGRYGRVSLTGAGGTGTVTVRMMGA